MTAPRVTCAIHQPNLFPRASTLRKIAEADVWIILDELVRDVTHQVATAVRATNRLTAVAELSARLLLDLLGWRGSTIHSSTLPARTGRSTRLADLSRHVGATEYLCGPGGACYLDEQAFTEQGIAVRYTTTDHQATRWQRPVSALRQLAMTGSSGVLAGASPILGQH